MNIWKDLTLAKSSETPARSRQLEQYHTDEVYRKSQKEKHTEYMKQKRLEDTASKPFLVWDSEGTNTNATIFLFGNSDGDYICSPNLSTRQCLNLILEVERQKPDSIHIMFSGEYDVNMWLRELPRGKLFALKMNGKVKWEGYEIEHVPRKWFVVKKEIEGQKVVAKIFDVFSFFGCSLVQALEDNQIGTSEQRARIKEGKESRKDFTFADKDFVFKYWQEENSLVLVLMNKYRDAFYNAGIRINSWHGPGAIARFMLKQNNIKDCLSKCPVEVLEAARYAFAGGRFESFKAGLYEGTVYNADINSAYPFAATYLPNLARGQWEYVANVDRSKIEFTEFALYHVRYHDNRKGLSVPPQPLFKRLRDDRVIFSPHVESWYWSPEAYNVKDNPYAEFVGAWIFHPYDREEKPFTFLKEYYEKRKLLKRIGDFMQITFKLGINSVYGQLAQRAGWERINGAPPYHQIEYAGFITSMCRAMVYQVAKYCWENDGLISIDTDGIFSSVEIPEKTCWQGFGTDLGQWETDSKPGILFWQSGVYFVPDDTGNNWKLKKSRGAPKGQVPYDEAIKALQRPDDKVIRYRRLEFLGYRAAMQRRSMDDWRFFRTRKRKLEFGGSEYSKRYHNPKVCRKCRKDLFPNREFQMHDLFIGTNPADYYTYTSHKHNLPWLGNDHERIRDLNDFKHEIEIIEQFLAEGGNEIDIE